MRLLDEERTQIFRIVLGWGLSARSTSASLRERIEEVIAALEELQRASR